MVPGALKIPMAVLLAAGVLVGLGRWGWPGESATFSAGAHMVVGLLGLIVGAEWLVRGAVRLARALGVSAFFIAVTVVAFGTSAPELAASIGATLKQEGEIAIGNVVGSNIANLLLILGVSAVIRGVPVSAGVMRVDMPIVVISAVLGSIPLLDAFFDRSLIAGEVSRIDGLLLVCGLIAYVWYQAKAGKVDPAEIEVETSIDLHSAPKSGGGLVLLKGVGLAGLGLLALIVGADWLVDGATYSATRFGMPKEVIGLTLVAVGTSIPELAFSIRAAQHGHGEMVLGNVLGSNVFNLCCVLGVAGLIDPIRVPMSAAMRDSWVMIAVTALTWALMSGRAGLTRPRGVVLLVGYAAYIALVVMARS